MCHIHRHADVVRARGSGANQSNFERSPCDMAADNRALLKACEPNLRTSVVVDCRTGPLNGRELSTPSKPASFLLCCEFSESTQFEAHKNITAAISIGCFRSSCKDVLNAGQQDISRLLLLR